MASRSLKLLRPILAGLALLCATCLCRADGSINEAVTTGLGEGESAAQPAPVPPKRNRKDPIYFSPYLYRTRNLVERFFNKIKQCRRVATRYDKLAANYLAFIKLASIRLWLRVYESTA